MKSRKTFNVADLLWKINYRLANSKPENVFQRLEAASLLEGILHNTGNYRGFCFNQVKVVDGVVDCGDESRRFYFISPALIEDYNAAEKRHQEMFK